MNLFFCTKAACLAGLSDRRLRHKHTSFWMFHSKTTLMAHMTVSLLSVTSTTAGNQECRSATGADRTLSSGPVLARTYVNPSPRRVFLKGFFTLPEAARRFCYAAAKGRQKQYACMYLFLAVCTGCFLCYEQNTIRELPVTCTGHRIGSGPAFG